MLWILASVAFALLCYEIPTLVTEVLVRLLRNPSGLQTDFHYYFAAAQRFSTDPSALYLPGDHVIAGFAYPPPAILPFLALSALPLGAALLVTTVASYGAILMAALQWSRYLDRCGISTDRKTRIGILLIVFASGPTYMNAIFGQVNAFVLASAVAFVLLAGAVPLMAGLLLASGAWLKLYPVLMLWVGAWDRRAWRAIGYSAAALVAIGALSLVWLPIDAYEMFLTFVLPSRTGNTAIHITNQSLVAFLERFRYDPALYLNWTGEQAVTISRAAGVINLATLAAALVALRISARQPHRSAHAVATLMALVAVIAPLGWGHTYVMVLPLVMLRLMQLPSSGRFVKWFTFAAVSALMIRSGRHLPIDMIPAWLQNLVYSRYLLATVGLILIPTAPFAPSTRRDAAASA
ncbi:MAG: hypothetical protein RLZZ53_2255 [Acidobacteriota bacterium]